MVSPPMYPTGLSTQICQGLWPICLHMFSFISFPPLQVSRLFVSLFCLQSIIIADFSTLQLQYPSLPWVRYITQSGDIAVRLPDVQG